MKAINTKLAPSAIGPYSQAVVFERTIYVSGQLPIDPITSELITDVALATKQSLENIKSILNEVDYEMNDIVKTTILLKNMEDFAIVNEVYATYFSAPFPARATYAVKQLPKDAIIEIEAIAIK